MVSEVDDGTGTASFRGVPLQYVADLWHGPNGEPRVPRHLWMNEECVRWTLRTGRPVWEWLWMTPEEEYLWGDW